VRFADRRQGDVDDRGVEDDDELRGREQDEREPAFLLELGGAGHDWFASQSNRRRRLQGSIRPRRIA
jgi:hypothetical protein